MRFAWRNGDVYPENCFKKETVTEGINGWVCSRPCCWLPSKHSFDSAFSMDGIDLSLLTSLLILTPHILLFIILFPH